MLGVEATNANSVKHNGGIIDCTINGIATNDMADEGGKRDEGIRIQHEDCKTRSQMSSI